MFFCKGQAFLVAGSQQFVLAFFTPSPDRAHGVDNPFCRKPVPFCNFCLACGTASENFAFLQKFRARSPVNRPVHASTPEQGSVCGVHYGVNFQFRDVGSENFNSFGNGFRSYFLRLLNYFPFVNTKYIINI